MRISLRFVIFVYACLSGHVFAQNYSGLTIDAAGSQLTDSNGNDIPYSQGVFGFAHDPLVPGVAQLPLADFESCDFNDSTLNGYQSGFQEYDFDNASFIDASLAAKGVSAWAGNSFEYADLQGATISANTTSSWGVTDFYHADLQGATLSGNGLSAWQADDFQDANLQGANLSGVGIYFPGNYFSGATINSSTIFWDGKNYQNTSVAWEADGFILVPEPPPGPC